MERIGVEREDNNLVLYTCELWLIIQSNHKWNIKRTWRTKSDVFLFCIRLFVHTVNWSLFYFIFFRFTPCVCLCFMHLFLNCLIDFVTTHNETDVIVRNFGCQSSLYSALWWISAMWYNCFGLYSTLTCFCQLFLILIDFILFSFISNCLNFQNCTLLIFFFFFISFQFIKINMFISVFHCLLIYFFSLFLYLW